MSGIKEYLQGCSTDGIVAVGLTATLLVSIFWGTQELSMNIATGLIGYIGGRHYKQG